MNTLNRDVGSTIDSLQGNSFSKFIITDNKQLLFTINYVRVTLYKFYYIK